MTREKQKPERHLKGWGYEDWIVNKSSLIIQTRVCFAHRVFLSEVNSVKNV